MDAMSNVKAFLARAVAGLNFGDCFPCAPAERTGHRALHAGDDVAATGIAVIASGTGGRARTA